MNSVIYNFFNSFLQTFLQLKISQLIDVLEPVLNELPQHSGLINKILKSFELVLFEEFILMLIQDFFPEGMDIVAFMPVVDFIGL